jgi:hypothetical protein
MSALSFRLTAPQTGPNYVIHLEAPPPAELRDGAKLPAVLFMDGDDLLSAAVGAYRQLRQHAGVPPLLLAGVGYGAGYRQPANRRNRDYTPTAMAGETGTGGAPAFLEFLAQTLWPELARRYPLAETARGIAGHSLGSLFALYAVFQRAPFFTRILASSPSVWYDDRSLLPIAAARAADPSPANARVFLSVGENDTPSMTGDLALLEAQLAQQPVAGLEVISRRFPGRDHYNVLPDAFGEGLRALYGHASTAKPQMMPKGR